MLVCHLYGDGDLTVVHHQSAVDDTGQDVHIDVASGNHAHHVFSYYRYLVKECGCHGYGTCTFCYQLLLFDQQQDGSCDFIFSNCNEIIDFFFDYFVCQVARFLYLDTVGEGLYVSGLDL